jgi:hypothetical protein
VSALAVVPLLALSWKGPLGEPVADDYHFLHRALLERNTPWDGGGAIVYWRPLARQAYYELLGPLMLDSPRSVALLHAALLALAALLLYRVLRRSWSGPWAAAAATFPVLAESSRALLLWPSTFQDLGALLFSALALHEAAHGRRWTALPSLLAALLCKEIAIVTALLLPWMPVISRHERRRWLLTVAAVLVLWGLAYLLVIQQADIVFQRHLESGAPSWPSRLAWALVHGLDDAFNLRALPARLAVPIGAASAILVASAMVLALQRRRRDVDTGSWIAWGAAWFAACIATLSEVWPVWGAFRSVTPMVGLGIACVGLLRAAGTPGLTAFLVVRLMGLALSPALAERIEHVPPGPQAGLELPSLVRLQRLAGESRRVLLAAHPSLPRGARVAELHRPLMSEHAFADGKALQVWYRDSTLRWMTWSQVLATPDAPLAAAIEYEPHGPWPVVAVSPAAVQEYLRAREWMAAENYDSAFVALERANALQENRGAAVFLGRLGGRLAICYLGMGNTIHARRAAEQSISLWPEGNDSRYALAVLFAMEGAMDKALAQLYTLLAHHPHDTSARQLLDSLRAGWGQGSPP